MIHQARSGGEAPETEKGWLHRGGIAPRKRLGQNFLIHSGTASRLVRSMRLDPDAPVLEIGAGSGALTRAFLDGGHSVQAVEVDPRLSAILRVRFAQEIRSGRLHLHEGSILEFDPAEVVRGRHQRPFLAGNLPYAITTPILLWALEHRDRFDRAAVLVQREVAARINADPGSRTYGSLSVWIAYHASARKLATVGPGSFWPVPEVESTLLGLTFHITPPVTLGSTDDLEKTLSATFGQRRKMLRASLADPLGGPDRAASLLEEAGIDGRRRPESLTLPEFALLANAVGPLLP